MIIGSVGEAVARSRDRAPMKSGVAECIGTDHDVVLDIVVQLVAVFDVDARTTDVPEDVVIYAR